MRTKINTKYLAVAAFFCAAPGINAFVNLSAIPGVPSVAALLAVGSAVAFAALALHQGLIALGQNNYSRAKVAVGFAMVIMLAEFAAQWLFAWTNSQRSLAQELVMAVVFSFMSLGGSICIALETWRAWEAEGLTAGFLSRRRSRAPREIKQRLPEVAEIFDELAMRHPTWTQRLALQQAFELYDQNPTQQSRDKGWIDELPPAQTTQPELPSPPEKTKNKLPARRTEPTVTATVADLSNVTNLDPQVGQHLELAKAIADEYAQDNEGKVIPRDELAKGLRQSGVTGSNVKDLADTLKRHIRAS